MANVQSVIGLLSALKARSALCPLTTITTQELFAVCCVTALMLA